MGVWGFYNPPSEPAYAPDWQVCEHIYEQESLDERAEQEDVETEDWDNDWGAWLEVGERPVPNSCA